MRKTLDRKNDGFITVNAETLAGMLDCGRATAVKIGIESGARIYVGRRALYNVSKVQNYLNQISGE